MGAYRASASRERGLGTRYRKLGSAGQEDQGGGDMTVELDLHLAMEGRHENLYERLGAHVREIDGVVGTAFAVWAPNARSVAVVGDFSSWDGRLHPMRSLGSSGIWELFVPGVEEGSKYKFELRTQDGRLRLKSDPVAFAAEVPPANASIVHRRRHEWADEEWLAQRA